MICHTKCVSSLPNLCGVPRAVQDMIAVSSSRSSMFLDDGSFALDITDGKIPRIEGWLRYPRTERFDLLTF